MGGPPVIDSPRSGRGRTPGELLGRQRVAQTSRPASRASDAPGSTSAHGTSTNARSCARGCGSRSSGSRLTTSSTATTSTSSVRAPQRTSRVRPAASSAPVAARQPVERRGDRVGHDRRSRSGSRPAGPDPTAPSRTPATPRPPTGAARPRRPAGAPADRRGSTRSTAPPASPALPADRHRDVGELQRDRRLRLVHRHRRGGDAAVGEAHLRQPGCQRLEQVRPARRRSPRPAPARARRSGRCRRRRPTRRRRTCRARGRRRRRSPGPRGARSRRRRDCRAPQPGQPDDVSGGHGRTCARRSVNAHRSPRSPCRSPPPSAPRPRPGGPRARAPPTLRSARSTP